MHNNEIHCKTLWTEGMLLNQQQFQQQEAYFESLMKTQFNWAGNFFWGFNELVLDDNQLTTESLCIYHASGIFPDGTAFIMNHNAFVIEKLQITPSDIGKIVYLCLPLARRQDNSVTLDNASVQAKQMRYRRELYDCHSHVLEEQSRSNIQIAKLQLKLLLEDDDKINQHSCLSIGKILSVDDNLGVKLESHFIPSMLDCKNNGLLKKMVVELGVLLANRANSIAQSIASPGKNVADIAEFLLLHMLNKSEVKVANMQQLERIHPYKFYQLVSEIYAELSTFSEATKRPAEIPAYKHRDLAATFTPLINQLKSAVQIIINQRVNFIDLEKRDNGIYVGLINDISLCERCDFVLAVKADIAAKELVDSFPLQSQIAPLSKVADFIGALIPALSVKLLNVVPPQLPYHAGFSYFLIDKSEPWWSEVKNCAAIAIHINTHYPNLQLNLWAVKK